MEQELLTLLEHLITPTVFSGVRVTRSLALCVCFVDRCLSFVLFLLAIVLSVLLRFTNIGYPFCIFLGSRYWLTYANMMTIERIDIDSNITETVYGRANSAVDIDIHFEKGLVYWTDFSKRKISRYTINFLLFSEKQCEDTNRIIRRISSSDRSKVTRFESQII